MSAKELTFDYAQLPNGIRLHYAARGAPDPRKRPLVLMLHGFPEYWGAWRDVLPLLDDSVYAVAPDLRGFNLSSKPAEVTAYKAREILNDIVQLITVLGYGDAVVVAHDWGGGVAWNLAAQRPDLVQRLIILNSPHPIRFAYALARDPAQQAASSYINWLRKEGSEEPLEHDGFARLIEFFTLMRRDDAPWFDDERADQYRTVWSRGLTGGINYHRASPLYPPTSSDAGAQRLKLDPADFTVNVPTLVMWGLADTSLLPTLLEGLDVVVPGVTIERIERATHWLAHEEPQRVAARIHSFGLGQ
ncbi:MAG TPA: alpha/beta hydrolase [Burkholderiaceae bacterium]|nr:alpha/beta hydrolase [Burkholderiaceae bacterium]